MNVSDYDFALSEELIAQHPVDRRDHARMLIVDKKKNLKHVVMKSYTPPGQTSSIVSFFA